MNIEQVKAEAKKQFDKELTDEQAQTLLEKGGELTDEVLDAVAGGAARPTPSGSQHAAFVRGQNAMDALKRK